MVGQQVSSIAIVTGGSSGIGKAISIKLAEEGITVIIADIAFPDHTHENIHFRLCNVTLGDEVDSFYQWVLENVGVPDILILNAGRGIHEKLTEGDPEKWFYIFNLNVMGALRLIRRFVPKMVERESGKVIFISSVSEGNSYTYGGIYSASKAALENVAETLRLETSPHINVSIIAAGITETDFFNNQISGHSKNPIEEIGMSSLSSEDIADDVLYTISKKGEASINKIVTRPVGQTF
ncbi:putative oxidoreductase [Marivirga lumbricoides]|uniref:Oxidoreductase n=1 Tax=Marivirga lumbricoides TaxID=1046115 RepID=A0ABQ1M725_9BACT|nr:putative oxidoreductase [Marivirga lumbricoides]